MNKHGITANTPTKTLLGAGVFAENIEYDTESTSWSADILSSTKDGGSVEIAGEFFEIERDGALVKWKGQTVKQGGTAKISAKFAEFGSEVIKKAIIGAIATNTDDDYVAGFDLVKDKSSIATGDYLENFGWIGFNGAGDLFMVIIFDCALCTSGMKIDTKGKEDSTTELTFEAYASTLDNLETLPVRIYTKTVA